MVNIAEAKQYVSDTVELYLARDGEGVLRIPRERQRALFLMGAPGIGKTAIVSQVARELNCGLVSYSMTHHTRQSALGLPYIVEREYGGSAYRASEYTMSEIIGSVYDEMRESGYTSGILFLDEINCVSETLYPSMLQFLQFKTFGRHAVPDGWIVVCAGNPPEYNKSVHEFDVVTLDRLRKIEIEPDFDAWRSYALANGCHPAIVAFLDAERDCFYHVISTPEGKSFVTARAWDDLSLALIASEALDKPVSRQLIGQYVQDDDIASRFAVYYELFEKYRASYRVEEILSGAYSPEMLEQARYARFDERMALMELLLDRLSHKASGVLNRKESLMVVRDELRAIKASLEQGDSSDAAESLQQSLKRRDAERLRASSRESAGKGERIESIARNVLDACLQATILAQAESPASPLANALGVFDEAVQGYSAQANELSLELEHAFAFVEEAYGDDREMLVFVTDFVARPSLASFVALYGCDAFYRHNSGLLANRRQDDLIGRIDSAFQTMGAGELPYQDTTGTAFFDI